METDFTFNNELIKNFFEGSDDYIPVGELLYLHTHPLVQPNFLRELEALILKTGKHILKKKIVGYPITKLEDLAIQIGKQLPELTYENGYIVLSSMREVYKLCNSLLAPKP